MFHVSQSRIEIEELIFLILLLSPLMSWDYGHAPLWLVGAALELNVGLGEFWADILQTELHSLPHMLSLFTHVFFMDSPNLCKA